uniref:Bystin domain containing protein n=1 Tax=Metchnikovella dogieli TaxID=2804710 RepID=A0A896WNS4_9MICR|nr:bystin domain containing protein [Metchnikovella dogieli]
MEEREEKIFEVYGQAGSLLSQYRSGVLPRALTILPMLSNCRALLEAMLPAQWSTAGVSAMTKLFVNSKNESLQHFLRCVLYPAVCESLSTRKRLDTHLYEALRTALFKPQEFFKGIVIPLCTDKATLLREAELVAGILAKKRIPAMHAAAAMMRLTEKRHKNITGTFLAVFLKKKPILPFQALDALFSFFYLEKDNAERMPVLWHQNLLLFVRAYFAQLSDEQRALLLNLVSVQRHKDISPEIEAAARECLVQ